MEGSNPDPSAGAEEPVSPPAEEAQAPRRRGRRAAEPPVEAAAEEAPKRRRGRAKAADEGDAAVTEEMPKRRIARPRAKAGVEAAEAVAAEEAAPVAAAPKPRRARAKAAGAEAPAEPAPAAEAEQADQAPKPRRSRARAASAETEAETPQTPAAPPAPRRARARPARPSLRRGRETSQPERENVFVYATARYVRSSARKARMVCVHIRGKSVPEARAILAFAPRGVAKDWSKLLNSAVANAEHNFELIGDELRVKEAYADEGPTLKRFKPRAMGRATPIHKKTSHLSITLTPED